MHTFLTSNYTVIMASAAVLGAVGWLGCKVGIWLASSRIRKRLRTDRDFGIALLEDLALRWGAKIELTETPGVPPGPT